MLRMTYQWDDPEACSLCPSGMLHMTCQWDDPEAHSLRPSCMLRTIFQWDDPEAHSLRPSCILCTTNNTIQHAHAHTPKDDTRYMHIMQQQTTHTSIALRPPEPSNKGQYD